jgi:hypothetical protein
VGGQPKTPIVPSIVYDIAWARLADWKCKNFSVIFNVSEVLEKLARKSPQLS